MKQALGFLNNRLSDLIIAISPAARDNLTDTGTNPDKIVTMFNGVEPVRRFTDDEKVSVRASFGIEKEHFICCVLARLVPEKGHMYILEAAGLLKDLPIRFLIAGAGISELELRNTAAAGKLDNCIFTGFIDDIAKVHNITDLHLSASYGTETSCLSVLEGMSLSIPAVVSDYGGNPYLITNGENGLVVPKCDSAALAGAIRKLYNSPGTLTQMGSAGLEIYNERFTSVRMARDIEQVYRTALSLKNKERDDKDYGK